MRFCGHCGRSGHNRRTCPERPEEHKKIDATWHMKPGRKKGSRTICSYCGLQGHNRRTCVHLKRRKLLATRSIESSVKRALSTFPEYGLGVGAMYSMSSYWKDHNTTYILTGDMLDINVDYREERYYTEYDTNSPTVKCHLESPTFKFQLDGRKVYGDGWDREEAVKLSVHNNLKDGQQTLDSRHIRAFQIEDCRNKWLGKSSTEFSKAVYDRLVERAAKQVEEYYRNKDNKHPEFGYPGMIEAEQLQFEMDERKEN